MENNKSEIHSADTKKTLLAIIGDTQRPFFSIDKNHYVRSRLIGEIAQLDPQVLLHLGDFVAVGDSMDDWKYLWSIFEPIKQKKIPIIPVIGNHDLYWSQHKAKIQLETSFPDLKANSYFFKRIGSLALVVLNSNEFSLSSTDWTEQMKWYGEVIESMDKDNSIHFILTACHHPPYTNSMVIRPHKRVQNDIVPTFLNSSKSKLFLSGHAHTYEHFVIQDKHFIVSGGGGGQRQPLLPPRISRMSDKNRWEIIKPFHFITLEYFHQEMHLRVHGFRKRSNDFIVIDDFMIQN